MASLRGRHDVVARAHAWYERAAQRSLPGLPLRPRAPRVRRGVVRGRWPRPRPVARSPLSRRRAAARAVRSGLAGVRGGDPRHVAIGRSDRRLSRRARGHPQHTPTGEHPLDAGRGRNRRRGSRDGGGRWRPGGRCRARPVRASGRFAEIGAAWWIARALRTLERIDAATDVGGVIGGRRDRAPPRTGRSRGLSDLNDRPLRWRGSRHPFAAGIPSPDPPAELRVVDHQAVRVERHVRPGSRSEQFVADRPAARRQRASGT